MPGRHSTLVYTNIFAEKPAKNGVEGKIKPKIKLCENCNIIFVGLAQSQKQFLCAKTKTKNFFCANKQFDIDNCFFLPYNN